MGKSRRHIHTSFPRPRALPATVDLPAKRAENPRQSGLWIARGSTAFASTTNGASVFSGRTEVRPMSKSSTTTNRIPNPTPGEMLLLDFIEPMKLTQNGLARAIGVPPRRINEIVLGKRAITADTDLRLARYFGLSEGFWMGVQADYELMERRRKIEADLAAIAPRRRAA
jgi:addiction module HigA family antidote